MQANFSYTPSIYPHDSLKPLSIGPILFDWEGLDFVVMLAYYGFMER